jgi:hypothetical protein
MEIKTHPNFQYSKYHKNNAALRAHIAALQERGAKAVTGGDKKEKNAFWIEFDPRPGGAATIHYRFGKEQKKPKYKKGQKFYLTETVDGKGVVVITKVLPDEHGRQKLNYYELEGQNFRYKVTENEEGIDQMLDDRDLKIIKP